MPEPAPINLIRVFDFYLAVMFFLSLLRRWDVYLDAVYILFKVRGRWPKLLQRLGQDRAQPGLRDWQGPGWDFRCSRRPPKSL